MTIVYHLLFSFRDSDIHVPYSSCGQVSVNHGECLTILLMGASRQSPGKKEGSPEGKRGHSLKAESHCSDNDNDAKRTHSNG